MTIDDGRWIAAGTREGDIYILDSEGKTHFTDRQTYDISQVYFGDDVSYVVTLSPELFEFSTHKLDNIGLMSSLNGLSLVLIIVFALLCAAALISTFPRSRDLAVRFFRSMYRHRVAYLMLAPSIILILIFNYYNVFQAFYYAFTIVRRVQRAETVVLNHLRRHLPVFVLADTAAKLIIYPPPGFVKIL